MDEETFEFIDSVNERFEHFAGDLSAIGGLVARKPTAWLHVLDNTEGIEGNEPDRRLSFSESSPFGISGVDHSSEFPVTKIPLYSEVEPDESDE